jgi:pilus assembly protein CpaE
VELSELHPSEFAVFLERHSSGVSLLAATESAVDAEHVTVPVVQWAIERLRYEADYILVDLPATFSESALAAIDAADVMCVVTTPHVAAAKATIDYLNVVKSLHAMPRERVFLAINHVAGLETGLEDGQVTNFLHHTATSVIPYAAQVARAGNEGRPFVTGHRDHPAARAIVALSAKIAAIEVPKDFERQLWTG